MQGRQRSQKSSARLSLILKAALAACAAGESSLFPAKIAGFYTVLPGAIPLSLGGEEDAAAAFFSTDYNDRAGLLEGTHPRPRIR